MSNSTDTVSRETLVSLLDQYIDAVIARDVSQAPLAPSARLTENGFEIPFGHGLWASASGSGGPRFADVVDPAHGEIATLCRIEEVGEISLLGLRLKTDGGLISEVESIVTRPEGSGRKPVFWEPENVGTAPAEYANGTAAPRADLLSIIDDYLDAIGDGDGSRVYHVPGAVRRENGFQTVANVALPPDNPELAAFRMEMSEQIATGFGGGIVDRDRRYVVDEERGLVFCSFFMEYVYSIDNYGTQGEMNWKTIHPRPTTMYVHETWAITDGKVTACDSIFDHGFYGMKSGW